METNRVRAIRYEEPDAGYRDSEIFGLDLLGESNAKQSLAKLDGFSVLYVDLDNLAADFGFDLIHQLHGLDDAQNSAWFNRVTCLDKGLGIRIWRAVERSNDRRPHVQQALVFIWGHRHCRNTCCRWRCGGWIAGRESIGCLSWPSRADNDRLPFLPYSDL